MHHSHDLARVRSPTPEIEEFRLSLLRLRFPERKELQHRLLSGIQVLVYEK